MIVEIPGTPPSKNKHSGTHWSQNYVVEKKWKEAAGWAVKAQCSPSDYPDPPVKLIITLVENDRRKRDILNYASRGMHGLIDGLVEVGVLEDDDYEHINAIEMDYVVEPERDDKMTVIEVVNNE